MREGRGGQTISISSSDPPHPHPSAVSLHCHTAVSTHADWGPVYSVHHGTARGEELQAKPPPHSRSAHKETGALCYYSLLTTDKSGLSTGKVAEAGFEVLSSLPPALPPSPRASLLSIHYK